MYYIFKPKFSEFKMLWNMNWNKTKFKIFKCLFIAVDYIILKISTYLDILNILFLVF